MNFSEEGWIEVAAKLCQEVHDAREVTLLIIRFVFPFESGIDIKKLGVSNNNDTIEHQCDQEGARTQFHRKTVGTKARNAL